MLKPEIKDFFGNMIIFNGTFESMNDAEKQITSEKATVFLIVPSNSPKIHEISAAMMLYAMKYENELQTFESTGVFVFWVPKHRAFVSKNKFVNFLKSIQTI